jgi:prefoldin alpha subunit
MNEEEISSAVRTLEFYRTQLENFDQQYEFMAMTIREHAKAKETMEGLKDIKEETETLIPIGAGSYLFAKVGESEKAIVGIGADVLIETTIDDAILKIDERTKEIEEAMKTLTGKYQEIANKATELSSIIQSSYVRE